MNNNTGYLFKGIIGFADNYIDIINYDDYKFTYTPEDWDYTVSSSTPEVIDHASDVAIEIGDARKDEFDYIVVEAQSGSTHKVVLIYNCFNRRYDYNEENAYKYLYKEGEPLFNKIYNFLKGRNLV